MAAPVLEYEDGWFQSTEEDEYNMDDFDTDFDEDEDFDDSDEMDLDLDDY